MAAAAPPHLTLMTKKRILLLLTFLLLLYVVVPRFGGFSESFRVVANANMFYVGLAFTAVVATYLTAAAVYCKLAIRHLAYRPTLLVQLASAFTNRLLPAGIGTLTLYVQYLRKIKHTTSQAVTVVGVNNVLGMLAHTVLLAIVLILFADTLQPGWLSHMEGGMIGAVSLVIGIIVLALLLIFKQLRQRAYRLVSEVKLNIYNYRKRPRRLLGALGFSLLTTVCYIAAFFFCAVAVDVHLGIHQIFMVFTVGMITGTVTPTPGGLVGAEAGLTGGLIAYGVLPDTALAAVLLYRFLTYWLPLIPGFITFIRIRRLYS